MIKVIVAVDADSNQLTGHRIGTSGRYNALWSHDNAGNQMEKETNTWTYGGDNRVRRLTRSSGFYYENWYDTNELYFVHNDHLGRPHKVTDDTKAVVWEADLQSFDRSVVSSSIGTLNIGFPGQIRTLVISTTVLELRL